MATPNRLEHRLTVLLNSRLPHMPITMRAVLATAGIALVLLLGLAGMQGWHDDLQAAGTVRANVDARRHPVVILPGGIHVTLEAISDNPRDMDRWWRPDGTPLPVLPDYATQFYDTCY